MSDGRRFEDSVTIDDLMKKPQKELLTMIYIQALKTNGQVSTNKHDIECLQDEVKEKIGWKLISWIGGLLILIISVFSILNLLANLGRL